MRQRVEVAAVFGGVLTGFLAYLGPVSAQEADLSAVRRQIEALKADYEGKIRDLDLRLAINEARTDQNEAKTSESAHAAQGDGSGIQINAVLHGGYSHFSDDPAGRPRIPGFVSAPESSLGGRGFSVAESELRFQGRVEDVLTGQLTLAISGDNEVELEEAFVESLDLPMGLTARGGRFLSGIGHLNRQHAHEWDFIDAPLPYVAFLGNQYRDDGVQLRWRAPSDMFLELGGEALRGNTFPGANPSHGKGAYSAFARFGDALGAAETWRGGLSYLRTEARGRDLGAANDDGAEVFTGFSHLGVASLAYNWAPDGDEAPPRLKLLGEYFRQEEQGSFDAIGVDRTNDGWYLQGVYRVLPRWSAGLRYDRLSADDAIDAALAGSALDAGRGTPQRGSALLEYDASEFGRFRLQYSRDDSLAGEPNNIIRLQYTVVLGPHGAHDH